MRDEIQGGHWLRKRFGGDLDIGSFTGVARQRSKLLPAAAAAPRWRHSSGVPWPRRPRDPNAAPPTDPAASRAPPANRLMAMPLDHPADGKIQQLRARIDGERPARPRKRRLRPARPPPEPQRRPQRDGRLRESIRGGGEIDEFRIGQQRRARQHDRGNIRMVSRKGQHHIMRHMRGACEIFGQGAANEGRGIVKQPGQDEPDFSRSAVRKIAIKKGAREHRRGPRPRHRRSGPLPFQEFSGQHGLPNPKTSFKMSFFKHGKGNLCPPPPVPPPANTIRGCAQ